MLNDIRAIITFWLLELAVTVAPDDGLGGELCQAILKLKDQHVK